MFIVIIVFTIIIIIMTNTTHLKCMRGEASDKTLPTADEDQLLPHRQTIGTGGGHCYHNDLSDDHDDFHDDNGFYDDDDDDGASRCVEEALTTSITTHSGNAATG